MRYIHPYCALSARSIYENIVYGMQDPPGPESQEFVSVCKQAQAWDFINKFPSKQCVGVVARAALGAKGTQSLTNTLLARSLTDTFARILTQIHRIGR